MSILSKLHTQVHVSCTYYSKQSTDSMQSPSKFQDVLQKNRIYNTKICIEPQMTLHIQITLEKEEQRWGSIMLLDFKLYHRAIVIKWIWYCQSSTQSSLNIHWKDCCWSWNSNIMVSWYKKLIHWKRPWSWQSLKTKGEGGGRGWDHVHWPSLTQWTWIWANYMSCGGQRSLVCYNPWGQTRFSDWTTTST